MAYSYAIEQAIRAASVLHKDHVRKGPVPYPYMTHLFAVAMIVADYTTDEDTIVASLLHDTLEYTDYTEDELGDDFGGPVKELVLSVTEPLYDKSDRKASAEARKAYVKQLKDASERALVIVAADRIHTMRSAIEEYLDDHSGFVAEFGTDLEDSLLQYQEISNTLNRNLKNAILAEFNSVFTEYKNFIRDVQAKRESY
ncbi:MAG TPA: HD domain-containing protein [Candidatus Paceibacterota bacterium]|nr:HD domain-containing protein [Candidatus Paceibacterota bacterium]